MPRASQSSQSNLRKSSKKTTDEYDEQYDDLGDESVPTQGGSGRSSVSLLPEELQSLVNDTVYYLLIANQRNCPVKKQDIVKNVLKEKSKTFPLVIQKVKIILKQVFGMNLTELQGRPGLYLLLNDLDIKTEFSEHTLNWSEEENGKTGLLFFILSLIFMNGNVVVDNVMWTTLKRLGLDHEIGPHSLFGDIKKLVTQEFVRQQYIEYTRIPGSDPALYEFRWGPRAQLELSKKELLEFVCYLYGNNMQPEQWTSQYQDVLRSEEQDED